MATTTKPQKDFARVIKRNLVISRIWKDMLMITVAEAWALIEENTELRPSTSISIEDLREEVLRQNIESDRCYPAFNRVAMDGVAINSVAWEKGIRCFPIENVQKAGSPQLSLRDQNSCLEVMTGASLPEGCDCVIRYEDVEIKDGHADVASDVDVCYMKNVHQKGKDYAKSEELVTRGDLLSSPQCAVAASVGQSKIEISNRPKIALISTGDELVEVDQEPKDYQIRRSNVYALKASLSSQGFHDVNLFHIADSQEIIADRLSVVIDDYDVIILSGGVSKGKFDFIPNCLKDLGVKEIFHKIKQKPGKPLWFGIKDQKLNPKKMVFALPGNPVSAVVCLHKYVLPSLWKSLGRELILSRAKLTQDVSFKKNFTLFLPVQVSTDDEATFVAKPVKNNGSGDFSALVGSTGFLELPSDKEVFKVGEVYSYFSWRNI